DERPVRDRGGVVDEVARVGAVQHRAEEGPVGQRVHPPHRVGVPLGDAAGVVQVERDRHLGGRVDDLAQGAGGEPVAEVEVVQRGQRRGGLGAGGGVHAGGVAEVGRAPRLVQRDPGGHAVAERLAHPVRVGGEPVGGVAVRPAARVLQLLRQVPVVEGGDGGDVPGPQPVHQPPVEVEPGLVEPVAAAGQHTRPGDGEAVGADAQLGEDVQVLFQAVVVVAGQVAGVAVGHQAGGVGEGVPDGRPAAVLVPGTLHLVGGRGRTPQEVVGESGHDGSLLIVLAGHASMVRSAATPWGASVTAPSAAAPVSRSRAGAGGGRRGARGGAGGGGRGGRGRGGGGGGGAGRGAGGAGGRGGGGGGRGGAGGGGRRRGAAPAREGGDALIRLQVEIG